MDADAELALNVIKAAQAMRDKMTNPHADFLHSDDCAACKLVTALDAWESAPVSEREN